MDTALSRGHDDSGGSMSRPTGDSGPKTGANLALRASTVCPRSLVTIAKESIVVSIGDGDAGVVCSVFIWLPH
jgi:hypothetical protein